MTVFVDDARNPLGRMVMSHMLATGEAELHAMANRIGVDRAHFQGDHYDVCQKMRARAVAAGAVEITQRDAAMVRRHRLRTGQGMTHEQLKRGRAVQALCRASARSPRKEGAA